MSNLSFEFGISVRPHTGDAEQQELQDPNKGIGGFILQVTMVT